MRLRLLPHDPELGWLPYAWLCYLAIFLIGPLRSRAYLPETITGTAVFLVLYFWGHWLRGPRKVFAMAGLAALGSLFAPINPGASVFFVYAAAFTGEAGVRWLYVLLALVGLEAYLLDLHPTFWIPALGFSALIGVVDVRYKQRGQLAKLAERERIGRDLHDLLGHTLSLIVLKSELASKLAEKDTSRAIAEIRDVERISREALAEVRSAVTGYRGVSLTAEARHAREALESAGIAVDSVIDPVSLSSAQEGVLVLALREAVTNIVRHARATSCRVSVRSAGKACELEVADNGLGGAAPEGSGLSGMRERIESLGGSIERDGSAGTRLLIRLPLMQ